MDDDDLAARLDADPDPRRVTALPDGSIDFYYDVYGEGNERIETTEEFAAGVIDGRNGSFRTRLTARELGGQAVNAARQAHALGDEVTLFGHLDDPNFERSPFAFETHSMGEPAAVRILDFGDDELLLADNSPDVATWDLADLERVVDGLRAPLTTDAVCWGNWASVESASEAFRTLAERSVDGDLFVLDPGNVAVATPERVRDLPEALRTLGDAYDVVVSANRAELRAMADVLDEDRASADRSDAGLVTAVRDAADATGVVMHETQVAVAATSGGVRRVPNYEIHDAIRPTGAGDRFTAALIHALVREWNWSLALGLGNLAATHYVETGETGDRDALREFLRTHERKE